MYHKKNHIQEGYTRNELITVECMFLSNTTLFYFMVEVYLHLLPKVQLHVSALGNSHLQFVHEPLESSYARFNMGCVQWGCGRCGGHFCSPHLSRLNFT